MESPTPLSTSNGICSLSSPSLLPHSFMHPPVYSHPLIIYLSIHSSNPFFFQPSIHYPSLLPSSFPPSFIPLCPSLCLPVHLSTHPSTHHLPIHLPSHHVFKCSSAHPSIHPPSCHAPIIGPSPLSLPIHSPIVLRSRKLKGPDLGSCSESLGSSSSFLFKLGECPHLPEPQHPLLDNGNKKSAVQDSVSERIVRGQ